MPSPKLARRVKKADPVLQPVGPLMTCGHCKRHTGLVHAGSGPALCCECVSVHRKWLALGGNEFARDDKEHKDGRWCKEAIEPIRRFEQNYASRSGVTVEFLWKNGREVRSCKCNDESCEGLQMAHTAIIGKEEGFGLYDYTPAYPRS